MLGFLRRIFGFGSNDSTPAVGYNIHAGRHDDDWVGECVVGDPGKYAGCSCQFEDTSASGRGRRPGMIIEASNGSYVGMNDFLTSGRQPRSGNKIGPLSATRRTGSGRVEARSISCDDF